MIPINTITSTFAMIGEELKILFKKDQAYLTTDKAMSFNQLDLPKVAKTFKTSAYWTIRVLDYDESERRIFCEIISYQIGTTQFGENQKLLAEKLNQIEVLSFRNINTSGMLKTLNLNDASSTQQKNYRFVDMNQSYVEPLTIKPFKKTIRETFFINLKNVNFKHGCVSFNKKFKQHEKIIEIKIANDDIREEFDAVKNYFANVLKTKKIEVTVNIEFIDNELTFIEVKSPEINRIDRQFIDDVKFDFVKSTINKKIDVEINKTLFTMEEYLETYSEVKINNNPFYDNPEIFLNDLLLISDTKHYNHLRFLSSRHSHNIMKLRFIHKPFSFVFLIQGNKNYHFVWETLDTEEATYIWEIENEVEVIKLALEKLNDTIKTIKIHGRMSYINSTQDKFKRIKHDYTNSKDGFRKWKNDLELILT